MLWQTFTLVQDHMHIVYIFINNYLFNCFFISLC